jgi:hypothetical protein
MYSNPIILPLDAWGKIYVLQDEKGNTIGTGTREVCEVLMCMIKKPTSGTTVSGEPNVKIPKRLNVRAAIAI